MSTVRQAGKALVFSFLVPVSGYADGISGGIAGAAAIALLFMTAVAIVPAGLLLIAYRLRAKRKFTDVRMILLTAPSILYGALCSIYLPVALYELDLYAGLVGIAGVALLFASYRLYVACKHCQTSGLSRHDD